MDRRFWGMILHRPICIALSFAMSVVTAGPVVWAESRSHVVVKSSRVYSFKKNGKQFFITKVRNENGRLLKQIITSPDSTEIIQDLQDRGVFDYWSLKRGSYTVTASKPLLGQYRIIEIDRVIPEVGSRLMTYAYSFRQKRYLLVGNRFEKAVALTKDKVKKTAQSDLSSNKAADIKKPADFAIVFAGGAIVDDFRKGCGMANQGYKNPIMEILEGSAMKNADAKRADFMSIISAPSSTVVGNSCQPDEAQKILESLGDIAMTADPSLRTPGQPTQFLSCLEDLHLAANASHISAVLGAASCRGPLFSCDSEMSEFGHYSKSARPPTAQIALRPVNMGLPIPKDDMRSTIFHELVHMSGVTDENLTEGIEGCCTQPKSSFNFNNSSCRSVKEAIAAEKRSQDIRILRNEIEPEEQANYIENIRKNISAKEDSQGIAADMFAKRSDKIFEEEFVTFRSKIDANGTCSKEANANECLYKAGLTFENNFQQRVYDTCKENSFQAVIEDGHRNVQAVCSSIATSARVLASGMVPPSLKDFNELCKPMGGPASVSAVAPMKRRVFVLEVLDHIIEKSFADDFSNKSSSRDLGFSKTQGSGITLDPQANKNIDFPDNVKVSSTSTGSVSPSTFNNVKLCQLGEYCYGKTSEVVSQAEVSADQNRRITNDAPSEKTQEDKIPAKTPKIGGMSDQSHNAASKANTGGPDVLDHTGSSSGGLAANPGPAVPSIGGSAGDAKLSPGPSEIQLGALESGGVGRARGAGDLTSKMISTLDPVAVDSTPAFKDWAGGGGDGTRNNLISDRTTTLDKVVTAVTSLAISTAYADTQAGPSAGERLRQLTDPAPPRSIDLSGNSTPSRSANYQAEKVTAGNRGNTMPSPSRQSQSSQQTAPGGSKLANAAGSATGAQVVSSAEKPKTIEKSEQKRALASVSQKEYGLDLKPEFDISDLAKQLAKNKSDTVERQASKLSFITRLIELRVRWVKRDGLILGSTRPMREIVFNKDKQRYVLQEFKMKEY